MANEIITIRNADIIFSNLEGRIEQYNKQGKKVFSLLFDAEEYGPVLDKAGIAYKENNYGTYVKVQVNYEGFRKPSIYIRTPEGNLRLMPKDEVGEIDSMDILSVDAELNAYHYETPQGSGVVAYLKTLIVEPYVSPLVLGVTHIPSKESLGDEDVPFE